MNSIKFGVIASFFSQVCSSIINLLLSLYFVKVMSNIDFGIFSLMLLCIYCSQSLVDATVIIPSTMIKTTSRKFLQVYTKSLTVISLVSSITFCLSCCAVISIVSTNFSPSGIALSLASVLVILEAGRRQACIFGNMKKQIIIDVMRLCVGIYIVTNQFGEVDLTQALLILVLAQSPLFFCLNYRLGGMRLSFLRKAAARHLIHARWYILNVLSYMAFDAPASLLAARNYGIEYSGYLRVGLLAYAPFNLIISLIDTWLTKYLSAQPGRFSSDTALKINLISIASLGISLSVVSLISIIYFQFNISQFIHSPRIGESVLIYLFAASFSLSRTIISARLKSERKSRAVLSITLSGAIGGVITTITCEYLFGFDGLLYGVLSAHVIAYLISFKRFNSR